MSILTPPPPRRRRRQQLPVAGGTAPRSARGIGAPRDTGLTLRSADERARRRRASRRRARIEVAIVGSAALIALVIGWRATLPAASPRPTSGASTDAPLAQQVAVTDADLSDPTPFFANYRSLHLYLPVQVQSLTEIGFHQASGTKALHMESLLPDANMNVVAQNHSSGRVEPTATVGPAVLTGSVLRMWRSNRRGAPDTAVDIGALPGTLVYAPVTGTVVQVRAYKLYDKYDDYEIHIQPNGWPEVDVVLIHVDNPTIKAGDRVIGGITNIAEVRKLSDRVTPQISAYTKDAGDHVHMQLNKLDVPGKLEKVDGS